MVFEGYAQLVIGPAGAGKTTYCLTLKEHCLAAGRSAYIVNLDPAAHLLPYEPDFDIRDLVRQVEVMPALELGPNGALVFCFEAMIRLRRLYSPIMTSSPCFSRFSISAFLLAPSRSL